MAPYPHPRLQQQKKKSSVELKRNHAHSPYQGSYIETNKTKTTKTSRNYRPGVAKPNARHVYLSPPQKETSRLPSPLPPPPPPPPRSALFSLQLYSTHHHDDPEETKCLQKDT